MAKDKKVTKMMVTRMLKENTGKHFMDSGGSDGRAWQRNQARNFASEPVTVVSIGEHGIDFEYSTYHWLSERLTYNPAMTAMLHAFAESPEQADCYWLQNMEDFADILHRDKGYGNSYTVS